MKPIGHSRRVFTMRKRLGRGTVLATWKVGSDRTAVYRWYDAADVIIYVGISNNPYRRRAQHEAESWWFPEAVRSTVEWFPSREAACDEENRLIRLLRPKGNYAGNPDRDPRAR